MIKVALLDACVLYPFSVRDVLLQFSVDGHFQAKWSSKIEEEMIRNVERNQPHLKGKLTKTVKTMRRAIPDYSSEPLISTVREVLKSKTDAKDAEILAAAIDGHCDYLVTYNLKDFDSPFGLSRQVNLVHPDEFLWRLVSEYPQQSLNSFQKAVSRLKKPPRSEKEYCEALRKNNLIKFVDALKSLLDA